jgi:hypothetical protein
VAERALALLPSGSTFLDVSVPGRAVSVPDRLPFPHRKALVEVECYRLDLRLTPSPAHVPLRRELVEFRPDPLVEVKVRSP